MFESVAVVVIKNTMREMESLIEKEVGEKVPESRV